MIKQKKKKQKTFFSNSNLKKISGPRQPRPRAIFSKPVRPALPRSDRLEPNQSQLERRRRRTRQHHIRRQQTRLQPTLGHIQSAPGHPLHHTRSHQHSHGHIEHEMRPSPHFSRGHPVRQHQLPRIQRNPSRGRYPKAASRRPRPDQQDHVFAQPWPSCVRRDDRRGELLFI